MSTVPVMDDITAAVERFRAGDVDGARAEFARLWPAVADDPFHRCVLAHYAADAEPTVEQELQWDRRALEAADEITDDPFVTGFYPSLHLNLADDHRKLGDHAQATRHLALARSRASSLADDDYGRMIRAEIERCAAALDEARGAAPPPSMHEPDTTRGAGHEGQPS